MRTLPVNVALVRLVLACGLNGLVCLGAGASLPLASWDERQAFIAQAKPAYVTAHLQRERSLHEDPRTVTEVRLDAILLSSPEGAVPVLPTGMLGNSERVRLTLADGRTQWARVPKGALKRDAPLVQLRWEAPEKVQPVKGLDWHPAPEMGPGRRVWLLERSVARLPDGVRPEPVLVQTYLKSQAAPPFNSYWSVPVQNAIGAPLLDDAGAVICVIFRRHPSDATQSLCTPEGSALLPLAP